MNAKPAPDHNAFRFLRAVAIFWLFAAANSHFTPAQAATFTWDPSTTGTGSDGVGTWSNGGTGNWANGGDSAWNNNDLTDNAVFGVGGTPGTVTVSGTVDVGNITFNPLASSAYTLTSGTIILNTGTITTNAASANINSVLAGSVGLTTSGTGALILGGVDTYTGNTTINGLSTLQIGGSGDLGSGSYSGNITDNGALTFNTSVAQTLSGAISGTGAFTQAGTGITTLTGSNTFSGTTTVTQGALYLSSATGSAAPGNITLGNGSTTITPSIVTTQANQFGPGTVISFVNGIGGYTRLFLDGNNESVAGLSDAIGAGVIENSGYLYGVSSSPTVTASQSGTLTLVTPAGSSYSYVGFLRNVDANGTGTISVVMSGSGQQTLSGANITYTGPTTVNSGTLGLYGASGFASHVTVNSGGTLSVTGTGLAAIGSVSGADVGEGGSGSDTINSGGVLSLINNNSGYGNRSFFQATASGAGTLIVSGGGWFAAYNVTNTITLSGGISILSGGLGNDDGTGAFGTCTAPLAISSGAYFDLRGASSQFDALSGAGGIVNSYNSATLTIGAANGSGTFSGTIVNGIGNSGVTSAGGGQVITLAKNGTGTQILTGSNGYTGATTINNGTLEIGNGGTTGSISSSSSISGASAGTLAFDLSSSGTISNIAASSPIAVTQNGSGSITLASPSYTGATTINSGTVTLLSGGFGSSNVTVNPAGVLNLVSSSTTLATYFTQSISGAGTLDFSGTGYVYFKAATNQVSLTGSINIFSGGIGTDNNVASFANCTAPLYINSGAFFDLRNVNCQFDSLSGSGSVVNSYINSATLTIGAANGSGTFSGVIQNGGNAATSAYNSGPGDLAVTKTGSGTEIFTGANTYTLTTAVNGGTLQIGNGSTGSLSTSSALSVQTGTATLAFDEANSSTISNNIADAGTVAGVEGSGITNTLSGVISGTGGFTQSGAGQTTLSGTGGYSGPTAVKSGTLAVSNIGAYASATTTIAPGAIFSVNNSGSQTSASRVIFTGSGTLLINGPGSWNLSTSISVAAFIEMNAGGLVDIEDGTVQDNNFANDWASNFGSVKIASGATLDLYADNGQMDALTGGGTLQNSYTGVGSALRTVTIGVSNGSGTFSGVISGTGANLAVTKTGTGTEILIGANTYAGATTINAGTLQIGNGGTTGSISSTSGVSGLSGARLSFDRSDSINSSISISGGIGVAQIGSGTLTLSGGNLNYTGLTSASAGTLVVAGGISGNVAANGGTLLANSTVGGSGSVNGGTLGGDGSIAGNVVVGTGSGAPSSSLIWPGAGGGTGGTQLTLAQNLTLNSDATFEFTLNSSTQVADALIVGGALNINGATLAGLDNGNTVLQLGTSIAIASYSSLTGTFSNAPEGALINVGPNWFTVDYGNINADEITLTAAIPEPGAWGSIALGFGMLIALQARRRARLN